MLLILGLAVMELGGRYILDLGEEDLGKRAYLPYFQSGHYLIHSTAADLEQGQEGPLRFGYENKSGVFLYDPGRETPAPADRFGFIFENWLSPYQIADLEKMERHNPKALRINGHGHFRFRSG